MHTSTQSQGSTPHTNTHLTGNITKLCKMCPLYKNQDASVFNFYLFIRLRTFSHALPLLFSVSHIMESSRLPSPADTKSTGVPCSSDSAWGEGSQGLSTETPWALGNIRCWVNGMHIELYLLKLQLEKEKPMFHFLFYISENSNSLAKIKLLVKRKTKPWSWHRLCKLHREMGVK